MENSNYFKDIFESVHGYKKMLLLFLIQNDKNLFKKIGFSKSYIDLLILEIKNNLLEGHEDYLAYFKNEEESVAEKFSNK